MEEISFKGEKYVKASVIAEKLGYTADYVGQLCRSKQVDATLVGRSWYVSEKSILEHKKSRYRSTLSKSKESIRKIAEERSTFRSLSHTTRRTSYGQDNSDLIPVIVKEKKPADSEESNNISRDIYPRTLESKPFNKPLQDSSEKYSNRVSTKILQHSTRALPPVRVISGRPVDMNTMPPRNHHAKEQYLARTSQDHRPSAGKKLALGVLAWLFFIIVSVGMFLVVVGLEKKVVITTGASEVILYNFNFETFKDFLQQIRQ